MARFVTVADIGGMRTAHCVNAVFTALAGVPGISRADVKVGRVEVEHDGRATEDALRGEGDRLRRGPIPDGGIESAGEMPGHRCADGAQPEECDARHVDWGSGIA